MSNSFPIPPFLDEPRFNKKNSPIFALMPRSEEHSSLPHYPFHQSTSSISNDGNKISSRNGSTRRESKENNTLNYSYRTITDQQIQYQEYNPSVSAMMTNRGPRLGQFIDENVRKCVDSRDVEFVDLTEEKDVIRERRLDSEVLEAVSALLKMSSSKTTLTTDRSHFDERVRRETLARKEYARMQRECQHSERRQIPLSPPCKRVQVEESIKIPSPPTAAKNRIRLSDLLN